MQTYFEGFWRMDWGFGNANKTAAFIALLLIGLWGLVHWRRWLFWPVLILNAALGVCLIHTFSRGGLIAASLGIALLVWRAPRPWSQVRLWAVVITIWCVLGSLVYLQAYKRLGQGIVQEDKSITNRLVLWKTAPQMMWDAPSGWGLGNSGSAYMSWYQPLDRGETYRTLVNSHLTWLVEFGWPLRLVYLFAWGAVFLLLWPNQNSSGLELIGCAVWLTFGVSAFFSSVAESPVMWSVPVLYIGGCLVTRGLQHRWPTAKAWILPIGSAVLVGLCLLLAGKEAARSDFPLRASTGRIIVGHGEPQTWVVATPEMVGPHYGRVLRQRSPTWQGPALGIVGSLQDIPEVHASLLMIFSSVSARQKEALQAALPHYDQVALVNPEATPTQLGFNDKLAPNIVAIFGDFSQRPSAYVWDQATGRPCHRLQGVGDFVGNWVEVLSTYRK